MPRIRLTIPLIFAFLLSVPITHLQAQQFDPSVAGTCPEPTVYGSAMSYYVDDSATPGGQNHRLANKNCADQELELSDQNSMDSTTKASSATTTYSYHVGAGRLNLQAEVNASGHNASIPISGGTYQAIGTGNGHVILWLRWVDTITLHSKTTKPVHKVDDLAIDPTQVVEIRLKLLNNGKNVCTGGGGESSFYSTSVALVADAGQKKQVIGGHEELNVDSDCVDQQNQGTMQVLLGLGQMRVELASQVVVNGFAKNGDGYKENVDVKVKLGEYKICMEVLKGPKDLTITSASGTDYLCSKK